MDKTTRLTTFLVKTRYWNTLFYPRFMTTLGINDEGIESIPKEQHHETKAAQRDFKNVSVSLLKHRIASSFQRDSGVKRNGIVLNLYTLSQAVIDGKLNVDQFVTSDMFQKLQRYMDTSIDNFTDTQIINILSSLLRMRIDQDLQIVRLLEHEVKFRLNQLSLGNIIKLLNFYKSINLTPQQNQLVELLGYKIHKYLQSEQNITLKDINSIIRLTRSELIPRSWLNLVDEKLLSMFTQGDVLDTTISRIISVDPSSMDYNSICRLFIELGECKRRPTPVLKSASTILLSMPCPNNEPTLSDTILETLNAIGVLSYPNQLLLKKLFDDFKSLNSITNLNYHQRKNILQIMSNLRWNDVDILRALVKDFNENPDSDHNSPHLASKLVQTCATLNYTDKKLIECYRMQIKPKKEPTLEGQKYHWLRYIWSLANLDLVDENQLMKILKDKQTEPLKGNQNICDSDSMKLLNLFFIAKNVFRLDGLNSDYFHELGKLGIYHSMASKKLTSKVATALAAIVKSPDCLQSEVHTPFGFSVDCEVWLDGDMKFLQIDDGKSLRSIKDFSKDISSLMVPGINKCAIICTLYEDLIANQPGQVVGHRKMISKILDRIGYKTIFIDGNSIAAIESSTDLADIIYEKVRSYPDRTSALI